MTSSALKIPDLRFEQSFRRSLHSNAVSVNNNLNTKSKRQVALQQEEPLPIEITPSIVIYTVIKDQFLMPFIQGLLWTSVLIMCRPVLYKIFESGRSFGVRVFNGLGLTYSNRNLYQRTRKI